MVNDDDGGDDDDDDDNDMTVKYMFRSPVIL